MSRPLRVLYEASLARNPAGTGTYVRGLEAALQARAEVEIVPVSFEPRSAGTLDTRAKSVAGRAVNTVHHLAYYAQVLPQQARRAGCDLIYCPSSLVPLRGATPLLMTVFDLTPLTHASTQDWLSRQYLAAMLRIGIRRAAGIATISQAVSAEIVGRFPRLPASRLTVAYPGPNPELLDATPIRPAVPDRPYVLMVGTVEPRKNHLTALRALAEHRRRRPGSRLGLVAAGSAGWHYGPVERAVVDLGLAGQVTWLGSIEPGGLKWLYQHARGLLFPSLYEGFGLPVLEAMRLECPVVAARIPPVVEIVGDAATLLDPTDVAGWAEALTALEDGSGSATQVQVARERAGQFTWEACARSAVTAIEAAAGYRR